MQSFVPVMVPQTGERLCRYVGDRIRFRLEDRDGAEVPQGWRALLRTNLGRGTQLRREILEAHTRALTPAGGSWRDIPMNREGRGWSLELPLAEVGYFRAKAYAVDARGWQHWPDGPDSGVSVHPNKYRTANILYCAFTRLFSSGSNFDTDSKAAWVPASLDKTGYALIPPSGKLRDLKEQLPHILGRLGCRILHLLPVNPTPTTYARFGRFGSPYAALDLTAIDPALVVFDKRSTGIDQFRELTYGAHLHGASVFLDIVINHTGWGSVLQERHPEWFLRQSDKTFISPGAWGVTWEDLVELKHENIELWDELSEVFLMWCARGVDGFRCDAGYKVPVPAWQYIVSRVQQQYPDTIFFLEGLGGAWDITEALLTDGGMQWAYSELFQNYTGTAIAGYLDHCLRQNPRVGLLVHYSETHDNDRLAAQGRTWSLLRNRLCALTSSAGAFGFTCGAEWLAPEKIRVHDRTSMNWGAEANIVPELAKLNQLLADHPAFFDGARLTRVSPADSTIYALWRQSEEGLDHALVLVNTSLERPASIALRLEGAGMNTKLSQAASDCLTTLPAAAIIAPIPRGSIKIEQPTSHISRWFDLLGQSLPATDQAADSTVMLTLSPGAAYCLSPAPSPQGLHGDQYRWARAQAAWGLKAISQQWPTEAIPQINWRELARAVDGDPARFLSTISSFGSQVCPADLLSALSSTTSPAIFPRVVLWSLLDLRRVTLVPPGHWLLLEDTASFRANLRFNGSDTAQNVESIPTAAGNVAFFSPQPSPGDAKLSLERYTDADRNITAEIRFLGAMPGIMQNSDGLSSRAVRPADVVLLTNNRGGMARLCVDLGRVNSKYDCVLAANLHPTLPVDRHVLAKRLRVWVNADGFLSQLDFRNLARFNSSPQACWQFVANAGDGRTVEIQISANMLPGLNSTLFCFSRPTAAQASGKQLPESADVRLTVRLDIEDRGFHSETKRNGGADFHFSSNIKPLPAGAERAARWRTSSSATEPGSPQDLFTGFAFTPATDRVLRVIADTGVYHPQPEWSENIAHPTEQSRGQIGSGDAYSPGWFELPLKRGAVATLLVTADASDPDPQTLQSATSDFASKTSQSQMPKNLRVTETVPLLQTELPDNFYNRLLSAVRAFVVKRGAGKTVIAGYPWFLDWGRDTFICARGLLAAGMNEDVKQLVLTFTRFERDGTLPNTIFGEDASNRDTSDAPLWLGLVCEELKVDLTTLKATPDRTVRQVLESIALNYIKGTPNGIRMDPASGLVWSPSHFTWMDTNFPACTPREGYPVEIQALWIRLLRQLGDSGQPSDRDKWRNLAAQAQASLEKLFWLAEKGYYSDVLLAPRGRPAQDAVVDDALRSNCLLVVSLGLSTGERARRCLSAALRYLVVPGALRSLAPLPVAVPLPNCGGDGRLLNDPAAPYWGSYEGDEDTRRKPAYHNGTAWTWTFPILCEALVRAWDFAPDPVAAARAYLGSMDRLMNEGCLGQIPEILDGDAPHHQRGCDAQAWGATEALRVWKLLR
jgi:starch synthase (maltosyl-transferring)